MLTIGCHLSSSSGFYHMGKEAIEIGANTFQFFTRNPRGSKAKAIDPKDVTNVPGTCIKCQRCVRKCTKGAKYFDDPAFLSHVAMLKQNFREPKENEVFL